MRLFKATLDDIPRILGCAREFCAIIPDMPLNEEHYVNQWTGFVRDDIGVIYLLEDVGEIVGGIGGIKHPELLTGRMTAVELFWYVRPEFRHGTWPIRLLHEFEVWAALHECHEIDMIHMECSMAERLEGFYQKKGYTLYETVYRKIIGMNQTPNQEAA